MNQSKLGQYRRCAGLVVRYYTTFCVLRLILDGISGRIVGCQAWLSLITSEALFIARLEQSFPQEC
jgi:hypothetical protein